MWCLFTTIGQEEIFSCFFGLDGSVGDACPTLVPVPHLFLVDDRFWFENHIFFFGVGLSVLGSASHLMLVFDSGISGLFRIHFDFYNLMFGELAIWIKFRYIWWTFSVERIPSDESMRCSFFSVWFRRCSIFLVLFLWMRKVERFVGHVFFDVWWLTYVLFKKKTICVVGVSYVWV